MTKMKSLMIDYTVEVINRFKGGDPIEYLKNYGWRFMTLYIKSIPKKKKCEKANWLSEEALQIAEKRSKRQRRKGKIYPSEHRVPKNSKER